MLNLNKLCESKSIKVDPIRRNLSQIISDSYTLMYETTSQNMRSLIESHIKDIRDNPKDIDRLSLNLRILETANNNHVVISKNDLKLCEDEELDDPRLETGEATVDPMTAVDPKENEEPENDAPKADPDEIVRFAENSKGKTFQKALSKVSTLNESTKKFNLVESIQMYKAANSAMTQMAIEYEHNPSFKETFNVLTTVMGRTTRSLLESIYSGKPVSEKVTETLQKYAKVLCEDDQDDIDDFIDWVDNEYPEEEADDNTEKVPADTEDDDIIDVDAEVSEDGSEDLSIEIPDDLTPEQAKDALHQIIDNLEITDEDSEDDTPVEDEVAELSDEEKADVKSFLCVLRGCDEDSEEAEAEPTDEELDALEEHVLANRKKKAATKSESNGHIRYKKH